MSIGIVVPIFNMHGDRLRNLNFNLDRMLHAGVDEIIVVEQVTAESPPRPSFRDGVHHIMVISSSVQVEKSRLINIGAGRLKTDFLWMNDADIYAPFSKIAEKVRPDHIFIKPFSNFAKFNQEQTEEFLSKRKIHASAGRMKGVGAGAFIFRLAEFKKLRGMDERYTGWGFEDMEFALRAAALYPPTVFHEFVGVHLYHSPEDEFSEVALKNRTLFWSGRRLIKADVHKQIKDISSIF